MTNRYHESVMVDEAVEGLHIKKLGKYIDATLGTGGHTQAILGKGGTVLGIDLDPEMVLVAKERLKAEVEEGRVKLVNGNFTDIKKIAAQNGFNEVLGVLFDLGVSNFHLEDLERGFSFENKDADLDMRVNPEGQAVKAYDLLNILRKDQLIDLFETTLDPGAARWITGRVLHSRVGKSLKTVGDMLEICEGLRVGKKGIREATLPFLALRIAVNSELENLKEVLPKAFGLLAEEGRMVVISFHSGEDAIVKNFYRETVQDGKAEAITFKPLQASGGEIETNKRARSAKMRIIQKRIK